MYHPQSNVWYSPWCHTSMTLLTIINRLMSIHIYKKFLIFPIYEICVYVRETTYCRSSKFMYKHTRLSSSLCFVCMILFLVANILDIGGFCKGTLHAMWLQLFKKNALPTPPPPPVIKTTQEVCGWLGGHTSNIALLIFSKSTT